MIAKVIFFTESKLINLPYESKTRADKRRITECADMLTDTALTNPAM